MNAVASKEQVARAAFKVASKTAREQVRKLTPSAKQSGLFFKHVIPAAVKPLHVLWHEMLGVVFLAFAALGAWKLYRSPGALPPTEFVLVVVFLAVVAAYGVSSVLKSRRIKRS
jgi:hypothetical protein